MSATTAELLVRAVFDLDLMDDPDPDVVALLVCAVLDVEPSDTAKLLIRAVLETPKGGNA